MSETKTANAPATITYPAELGWLKDLDIRFTVDAQVAEDGVVTGYVFGVSAGSPSFSERLNGRVVIPTTEVVFAVSPQELVGQHLMGMTVRCFETLRHAYIDGLQRQSKVIVSPS